MNRNLKRIIGIFLVVISISATMNIGSSAANEKLKLGGEIMIEAKKTASIEFVPEEDGDYMFYSDEDDNDNPYATLYLSKSGKLKKIAWGDDSAKSYDFEVFAHLKKGNKYVLKCSDKGTMGDDGYWVGVKKSPVKSIKFAPFNPIKICQNDKAHGKYKTVTENGKSVTYFEYNISDIIFSEGNELTVNYNDGKRSVTYDYDYHYIRSHDRDVAEGHTGFIFGSDKDGVTLENKYIQIKTDQKSNHWDKPGTYYATLTAFGKSVTVPVRIEKSPVEKIKYYSAEKINHVGKISESSNVIKRSGNFNLGDRLKVTYNDGRTVEYTYDYYSTDNMIAAGRAFVDKDGFTIFGVTKTKATKNSDGNYSGKVSYSGKTCSFKINCANSSDIKISFSSDYPLTVADHDERFGLYANGGREPFYYDIVKIVDKPGNRITVTDKSDTTVYSFDERTGDFLSKDGYRFSSYDTSCTQSKKPWKVGDNYINFKAYGKSLNIPVKVIKCSHKNTVTRKAVSATCYNNGYTEGKYCNTCHAYVSGHKVIPGEHKAKPVFKWNGSKAYVTLKCNVCNKTVFKKNERIADVTSKVIEKATMKKDGTLERKASLIFGRNTPYKTTKTEAIKRIDSITLSNTSYAYNGKIHKPSVTVKDADGKKLEYGNDYKLKYSNASSTKAGEYSITVTFIGKYEGTKTLNYKIV